MQGRHTTSKAQRGDRQRALDSLRQRIAAIETRPALAPHREAERPRGPAPLLALPPGLVTEIFADRPRDTGAALGFALGLVRGQLTRRRSAIILLQLADEAQEMGLAYGPGLAAFGLDPDRLVLARPKTIIELLWAMEEAMACRAVAAVIADLGRPHKALDFTASRRLSLRAAASGSSALLLRYGEAREASAARFRWRIAPALSAALAFDPRAPGPPRWRATLEKGRLAPERPLSADGEDYFLQWTSDGFVLADSTDREHEPGLRPALPRAQPAALGDGLSQAG